MSLSCTVCGAPFDEARFASCPVCLLTADLEPLDLGENVQLLEEIGRGGMGVVYRGHDRFLKRDVAVKLLREELADQVALHERFQREARALASLKHPNIVPIFEAGTDGEQSWITMELIEGPRLSRLIPLGRERALELTRDICEGLAYAHSRGILHRDIKPENVLVDENGHARLVDFGLAALASRDEPRLTRTGQAVGTVSYLAPEVLAGGEPKETSDVFAVGVLFYQLITGRLPVGAFEPLEPELDVFVKRALARDPEKRFANGVALLEAVRGLQEGQVSRPAAQDSTGLAPEDRLWMRAVAMVNTVATAGVFWALLRCLTPRVADSEAGDPLIAIRSMENGQLIERARFETWPSLGALALAAVAAALNGLLYAHWGRKGLRVQTPEKKLPHSRWLFQIACLSTALYALRLIGLTADRTALVSVIPVVGGVLELCAVFLFWTAFLAAERTGRRLRREPLLWLGFAICLVPPLIELIRFQDSWRPGAN